MNVQTPRFAFDNSYARELDGFYVAWEGAQAPDPRVLRLNLGLAAELGLDADALAGPDGAAILAGSVAPRAARRWRWPMPGTSSADSRRSSATGGRFWWARSSTARGSGATCI